jgi:hypothetical protein
METQLTIFSQSQGLETNVYGVIYSGGELLMKTILVMIFIVSFLSACSHSILVKECKQVDDDHKYVCKTVMPWQ